MCVSKIDKIDNEAEINLTDCFDELVDIDNSEILGCDLLTEGDMYKISRSMREASENDIRGNRTRRTYGEATRESRGLVGTVGLAKAIESVRSEIAEAHRSAEVGVGKIRFRVKEIELEMQCVVVDDVEAEAGFSFHVLRIGGKAKNSQSSTHTVTVKLEMDAKSKVKYVGDKVEGDR
jgi:hypothetical protein